MTNANAWYQWTFSFLFIVRRYKRTSFELQKVKQRNTPRKLMSYLSLHLASTNIIKVIEV